jgi:hypothetical protein
MAHTQHPETIALAIAVGFPLLTLAIALVLSAVVRRIERRAERIALIRAYTERASESRGIAVVRSNGGRL